MVVLMIYHVGFVVRDLAKSLEWYTEVLGLQVERDTPGAQEIGSRAPCGVVKQ
ncbi:MAG: VOC family protein, partial [Chloroflexi bacterium]|nr:VOC family protein [Chloroflexota bacterium]